MVVIVATNRRVVTPVYSLRKRRGRFHKNLFRPNPNRGSQGRGLHLSSLSALSGRGNSLSVHVGGLGGHGSGGFPGGVQVSGDPC